MSQDPSQPDTQPEARPDFDDDATRVVRVEDLTRPSKLSESEELDEDATRVVNPGAVTRPATLTPRDDPDDDATQVRPSAFGDLMATPAHTGRHDPRPSTLAPLVSSGTPTGTLPGHTLTGISSKAMAAASGASGAEGAVRQVGRYLIQSRLGRGGMATVYKAHDPQIGRDVAIKFLHASLAEDEECHSRFLREARAAGGLTHPNIVVVHDVGEIEGRPFMAMEMVDGQPLADVLEKTKQLPIRDAVVMGLQLARALDYAHTRGIVHRDIKPGNIMLLSDGKTIKVTDFGIAHMDDANDQRTQVGAVLGTPQYMSPEQTRGDKLDGRSDLFSAGIVLYQMLTGERPFRGDSLVAIATKIANDPTPSVTAARPDVPPALRRVVERCLAKQPAQRFQSGKELADALIKVLNEIDESAREKDRPRIVPLRIKWALAMAAIIAVVMGISATVITQRQYAALMGQATEYGASLARFIAHQNAAAALGESWDEVDVAINEMMRSGGFERILVLDPTGVVRAASRADWVGKTYKPAGTESLGALAGNTGATRYLSSGESILGFEVPITFQDKPVGRVALGIPEKPLTQVAQLSVTLMIILAVVIVLAVAVAMYFLGDRFAKPIKLVGESLQEIAKGNFTHRIAEVRKDEFGLLFAAFDAMADALQKREGAAGGVAEPSTQTQVTPNRGAGPDRT